MIERGDLGLDAGLPDDPPEYGQCVLVRGRRQREAEGLTWDELRWIVSERDNDP